MSQEHLAALILDGHPQRLVFADTDHIIRYMNRAAIARYEGGAALIGTSLFDCHNEQSGAVMREVLARMQDGLDEELITDNEKQRAYMTAVRDADGTLLGYFERYEPPVKV